MPPSPRCSAGRCQHGENGGKQQHAHGMEFVHHGAGELTAHCHQAGAQGENDHGGRSTLGEDSADPLLGAEFRRRRECHADDHEDIERSEAPLDVGRGGGLDVWDCGEIFLKHEVAIDECWDQHDGDLGLQPRLAPLMNWEASAPMTMLPGEPDVKAIEHRRLIFGIHVRDERITGGLDGAVGESDTEGGDEQDQNPPAKMVKMSPRR